MSALALRPARVPDEDRFEELFRGYYSRARGLARRRFPSLDAEEIAQEAMLRVLTHIDSIDGRRDPWPYIATITMNVGRDMTRALRPTMELDEEHEELSLSPAADEAILLAEVDDGLQSALGRLSPAGRQILTLHAYGDMSIGQIAEFLGCNDNTVRQKLFRARRQFVRVMDEVLAASAAVVGVLGWFLRRPTARRSGRAVLPASAITLSGAVFAVLGVATVQLVTGTGAQPDAVTTSAVMMTAASSTTHAQPRLHRSPATRTTVADAQPAATAVGPAEVVVTQPTSLLRSGMTNHERIVVHTPVGEVHAGNTGQNGSANGTFCHIELVSCE